MSAHETVLTTERLILRRFVLGDIPELRQVFDDWYAKRFYPEMGSLPMAERWVRRNIARYEEQGVGLWAACLKETGEVVGDCGLIYQTIQEQQEVEVAYHLRADQRGKGLATEAALACLDHGFNVLDCDRIVSMAHPDNHASKRVAQRVHQDWRRFTRDAARYYLFHTTREAHA
ncbi:MAG: GNAT family N-acetyltransferase [Gemmatimonadetes bacterium]|nr:GNAT family N-acetyltransferase [Gemmatimonadota bacterium]